MNWQKPRKRKNNLSEATYLKKSFKTEKNINNMRVKLEKPILNKFFKLITNSKKFINWKETVKKLSCSYSTLKEIRKNNVTLSKEVFEELLLFINPNEQKYFRSNAKYFENFWANKKRWKKNYQYWKII